MSRRDFLRWGVVGSCAFLAEMALDHPLSRAFAEATLRLFEGSTPHNKGEFKNWQTELEPYCQFGGEVRKIEFSTGGGLLATEGARLIWLDQNLELVGSSPELGFLPKDFALSRDGRIIYIIGSTLRAINNSNRQELASYPIEGLGICEENGRLYIANGEAGLYILNTQELLAGESALSPTTIPVPGNARKVRVLENIAYVATWREGLQILDVENPQETRNLGSFKDGFDYAVNLLVRKQIVAGEERIWVYIAAYDKGVIIVDATDPENLRKISSFDTEEQAMDVALGGEDGNLVYVADYKGGVRVIDFSDFEHPREIERARVPGDSAVAVLTRKNSVFVADKRTGVRLFNFVNENLEEIKAYETMGAATAVALIDYHTAIVTNYGGRVFIVDFSDKENPRVLSSLKIEGKLWGVATSGDKNYAYLAAGEKGLYIIDISERTNPQIVGRESAWGGYAYDVVLKDKLAFVADSRTGGLIVDVSGENPELAGSFGTEGEVVDLFATKKRIYVASGSGGFYIFGYKQRENPPAGEDSVEVEKLGRLLPLPDATHILGVSVVGENEEKAVIAEGHAGFSIVDISNPQNPQRIQTISLPEGGSARDVFCDGRIIYVADGENGYFVYLFDSQRNEAIFLSSFRREGFEAENVSAGSGRVAGANFNGGGVIVFKHQIGYKFWVWPTLITNRTNKPSPPLPEEAIMSEMPRGGYPAP